MKEARTLKCEKGLDWDVASSTVQNTPQTIYEFYIAFKRQRQDNWEDSYCSIHK